jgi:glycosyltransferase involved in cell wall biosynthesis
MAKITFVFPTKNEEKTIEKVIVDFNKVVKDLGHDVLANIIVDDSKDKTREIARKMGAEVLIGGGQGLGLAMYKGLKKSIESNPDLIIAADTDGQADVAELEMFIKTSIEENVDLVLGSRFLDQKLIKYNYKFINRFGIRVLVFIINRLTKLNITDSHGGIRVYKPEVIDNLEIIGTHTYVQETIIDAVEKGFKVKEIPSKWLERENGSSRIVSSIPLYIFYTLPVLILRSKQHIRFLYPLGILFIGLAFLDLIIVLIDTKFDLQTLFDRQSFHLILLLLSIGFNMFFFGFIIELIVNIKRKMNSL